jgi:signal transduction histidine kinase
MLKQAVGARVRVDQALSADDCCVLAEASMLELALLNLAINARDAMPRGGTLRLETETVRLAGDAPDGLAPGDYVVIAVHDTGTGMSDEVLAKAFDPFFTTKDAGKGTGLGLSQVRSCARQHGGTTTIASRLGYGTSIRIFLPRAAKDAASPRAEAASNIVNHWYAAPAASGRAARV